MRWREYEAEAFKNDTEMHSTYEALMFNVFRESRGLASVFKFRELFPSTVIDLESSSHRISEHIVSSVVPYRINGIDSTWYDAHLTELSVGGLLVLSRTSSGDHNHPSSHYCRCDLRSEVSRWKSLEASRQIFGFYITPFSIQSLHLHALPFYVNESFC